MKLRPLIGIEIAPKEIRAAYVRPAGSGVQLVGVASAPIPEEGMDADGVLNPDVMGDAVRRLCAQLDPKVDRVVVGLTSGSLVARVMEIPPVPDSDVRSVLRGEMDHYRILPAGQSAFDYFRLPPLPEKGDGESEEQVDRVLLMGAEDRLVASYRSVIDAGNLRIQAVEPGSVAVLRLIHPSLQLQEAVATVLVTSAGTDIFITNRGDLHFYRRVDAGVPELRAGVSQQAPAAPQKKQRSLLGGEVEVEELQEPAPAEAEVFNRQAVSLLMTEVQRSVDYFVREFPQSSEELVVRFCIDDPEAESLFDLSTQYLRSHAELLAVRDSLPVAPEAASALFGAEAFRYIVSIGLALRGTGGAYAASPVLDLSSGDVVIRERRMAPKAMIASGAASGIILVGTIAAALVLGNWISGANRRLTQTQAEAELLKADYAARVAILERQKRLTEDIAASARPFPAGLDFLAAAVSRRGCLTGLHMTKQGSIHISGEAASPRVIADIMDTINLSPMLQPIRLTNVMRLDPKMGGEGLTFDLQTGFSSTPHAQPASFQPVNALPPDPVQPVEEPAKSAAATGTEGGS